MIKKLIASFVLLSAISFAQLIGPKIVVQQDKFDFGDIKQGEKVTHNFVISNNGGDILKIENVRASCGCTAAVPEKDQIAPGESTELKVTFNSSGRNGKQHKNVYIKSNDFERPEVVLTITGNVVNPNTGTALKPVIRFRETQHNFGNVNEGDVVEYTFKFSNVGQSTLKITNVKTSCGCTAALISSDKIQPGEEGTLNVKLNTKNRSGKVSKTITVNSNDPKSPHKILTVYANVIKKG